MTIIFLITTLILVIYFIKRPESSVFVIFNGTVIPAFILSFIGVGRGVSLFGVLISLIGIILYSIKYKLPFWRLTKVEYLIYLLEIVMVISLFYTDAIQYGMRKVQLFLAINCVLVLAARLFSGNKNLFPQFILSLGWTSFIALILFMMLFYFYGNALTKDGRFGAVSDSGVNSLVLSWAGASSVACAIYLLIKRKELAVIIIPVLMGGILAMLATGSRGPFIALVFGALLTFLPFKKAFQSIMMILLLFVIILSTLLFFAPSEARYRLGTIFDKNLVEDSGRSNNYSEAVEEFLLYPLRGGGIGSFAQYSSYETWKEEEFRKIYPHNIFLEFASETGVIGLMLILIVFYYSIKVIIKIRKIGSDHEYFWELKVVQWLFYIGFFNSISSFDINDQRNLFMSIGLLAGVNLWLDGEFFQGDEGSQSIIQNADCSDII